MADTETHTPIKLGPSNTKSPREVAREYIQCLDQTTTSNPRVEGLPTLDEKRFCDHSMNLKSPRLDIMLGRVDDHVREKAIELIEKAVKTLYPEASVTSEKDTLTLSKISTQRIQAVELLRIFEKQNPIEKDGPASR